MCVILLLIWLARRGLLPACYFIQALTCVGLSLAVLFGDRPVLVCSLHIVLATMYLTIAAAHVRLFRDWI